MVGTVVILLLWFHLTAYIVLLGASINAAMAHKTTEGVAAGASDP
jgi:uncharacterized BrkB/YihY/UPF0761 family membrane protein